MTTTADSLFELKSYILQITAVKNYGLPYYLQKFQFYHNIAFLYYSYVHVSKYIL